MRIFIKLALVTTAPKIKSLFVEHFVFKETFEMSTQLRISSSIKVKRKKAIHQFE
jgi:hypothetical protein